jgi:hypothetical protein
VRSRSAANGIEAVSAPQAYLDLSRRWCSHLRIECGQCVMTETDGRSLGGTDCADWGLFQDLSACNELARREGGEVLPIPPDLTPHTGKPYETTCKWGAASPPFCFACWS